MDIKQDIFQYIFTKGLAKIRITTTTTLIKSLLIHSEFLFIQFANPKESLQTVHCITLAPYWYMPKFQFRRVFIPTFIIQEFIL